MTATSTKPRVTASNAYDIYTEAYAAGKAAAEAAIPTPMIVGTAKSLFDDSIDESKPKYFVSEGVCGFGYVKIRPARGAFVTMLKKRGIGYSAYGGGYAVPSWLFGSPRDSQSYDRAMAAAYAAAEVLGKYGITAYAEGRLD